MKYSSFFIAAILFTSIAQSQVNPPDVKIGNQIWMKKNLDVSKFRNGDIVPEVRSQKEWFNAALENKPAWCYYNNDPANGVKYGKLYNWYAVNDPRGLAPEGWHVPSGEDWLNLEDYLGGGDSAGTKMKSKSGWMDHKGKDGNGTNTSGFTGLPGGSRDGSAFSDFYGITNNGRWWSATENPPIYAWDFSIYYHSSSSSIYYHNQMIGLYVRCIKN